MKDIINFRRFLIPGMATFVLALSSCVKDFGDINVNPNAPTITDVDYIFTETLVRGAQMDGNRDFGVWAELTSSDEGLTRIDDNYLPSELAINTWRDCYAIIANLNEIIKLCENDPYLINKLSMARIWRAYMYGRLSDLYGDIPYTHGAAGNADPSVISPAFDTQKFIYTDLLAELKNAVASMDENTEVGSFGGADIIYNGDVIKWKKFGNSLRLRMALRISNVEAELAQSVIQEILSMNLLISSNEEGFHFKFNNQVKASTYYFYSAGLARTVPSKFLIDLLMETSDPRLAIYAQHPLKGDSVASYRGMPNGLTVDERIAAGYNFNTVSHIGPYFLREDVEGFTLSYAEVCFMLAEISLKNMGSLPENTEYYYNEGIRASMVYFKDFSFSNEFQRDPFMEISEDQISEYLNGKGKLEGSFEEKLEKIITQRWLVIYQEGGYEAFALVRRTHYPKLEHFDGSLVDLNTEYVQRMPYPIEEYSLNGEHTREAEERQGTKLWWSK